MRFSVRYWIQHPPVPYGEHPEQSGEWLEHSSHPGTRIGLHNALLSAQDRLSILYALHRETPHGVDVFIIDLRTVVLSIAEGVDLLRLLDTGELSWSGFEGLLRMRPAVSGQPDGSRAKWFSLEDFLAHGGHPPHTRIDVDA